MAESPKAMSLRFPDPATYEAIATAARADGVSLQEYVLSAAYQRATALERAFLAAAGDHYARTREAFAELGDNRPDADRRAAEKAARREAGTASGKEHAA